jgi:hypothetical protein
LIDNTSSFWNTDLKSKSALQNLKYSALPFQLEINKINAYKSAFNKNIVVITDEAESKQLENRNKKKIFILLFLKLNKKNRYR